MWISQIRDKIQATNEIIYEKELVTITLNGLSESWDSFASIICAQKEAPKFEKPWIACNEK